MWGIAGRRIYGERLLGQIPGRKKTENRDRREGEARKIKESWKTGKKLVNCKMAY